MRDSKEFNVDAATEAGLSIGGQRWSIGALISFTVIYLGSMFQVGYFHCVGIEFISLMGPQDWAIAVGLALVPILTVWLPLVLLYEHLNDKYRSGKLSEDRLLKTANFVLQPAWNFLIVLAGSVILLWLGLFNSFWILLLPIIIAFLILVMSMTIEMIHIYSVHGNLHVRDVLLVLLLAGCGCYHFGYFYASHIAGKSCRIFQSDGHFERGQYLRAIGGGHLVRNIRNIRFIPSDKLLEISCDP